MSYKDKRKVEAQQNEYRCRFCGCTASYETLSSYGARCGACYAAYLRGDREPMTHLSVEEKKDIAGALRTVLTSRPPAHAWAERLRERENAGERLTPAQRNAWRAVLHENPQADEAFVDNGYEVPR